MIQSKMKNQLAKLFHIRPKQFSLCQFGVCVNCVWQPSLTESSSDSEIGKLRFTAHRFRKMSHELKENFTQNTPRVACSASASPTQKPRKAAWQTSVSILLPTLTSSESWKQGGTESKLICCSAAAVTISNRLAVKYCSAQFKACNK